MHYFLLQCMCQGMSPPIELIVEMPETLASSSMEPGSHTFGFFFDDEDESSSDDPPPSGETSIVRLFFAFAAADAFAAAAFDAAAAFAAAAFVGAPSGSSSPPRQPTPLLKSRTAW